LVHAPDVRNPEKYPDCRTDLTGGAATQTFAPGGKHPCTATGHGIAILLPVSAFVTSLIWKGQNLRAY